MTTGQIKKEIFEINGEEDFNRIALALFHYQKEKVPVYRQFLKLTHRDESPVTHYSQIPCLPVTLFKNHVVTDSEQLPAVFFRSSGTEGSQRSTHYIADPDLYRDSILCSFRLFYGDPSSFTFLALLPSYLEKGDASLIFMVEYLMKLSGRDSSGFFLQNHQQLYDRMRKNDGPIFLIGVTYALLDFFESYPMHIPDLVLMETGGMKGRRKEMIREEVHKILMKNSGTTTIHSEYGMTELLSQAYSHGDGKFRSPPWMRVMIRDLYDPFGTPVTESTGIIHIIDLANIHSCAFLTTQDVGRATNDGFFEVLGRMDQSEWRGCNLMVQ